MKRNYVIPMNFMETGYVLNGAVSIRNAIEAGVLGVLAFFLCKLLPLPSGTDGIAAHIFIISPFMFVGAMGIQGDPISVFVIDFLKWRKRRMPSFYSTHSEAYTQEAVEMILDAPQMRDVIADMIDSMKEKMASEEVVYVEGKTFRFADDPEQAALKQAQEELQAKKAEEEKQRAEELAQVKAQEEAATPKHFEKPSSAKRVDAEQVSQMLVLDDIELEVTADGEEA